MSVNRNTGRIIHKYALCVELVCWFRPDLFWTMLRLVTSLGKTPEFSFVQENGVPGELKNQGRCGPTEGSQQSVERLRRTRTSQLNIE
jgi:hypothetical protein